LGPTTPNSYDEVPYESNPFPQSHPDRLAVMATLFGMKPKPINSCRVLELGCASGGNLIPMAAGFPSSRFVGVELSARQVADGQALIEAVGLKNIELRQMSIMDVNEKFGEFDYIIAHGVYSWVPDDVQEKILEICRTNLAAEGVAYVSYNTYPGWHYRGMIRDMMMYHTRHLSIPQARAAQARALLDFLAQSVPTENNAYGIMLKNELDLLRKQKDYYLIHEHLEDANRPLYFYEFAERTARLGLQYLGEAEFSTMLTANFPKQVADTLKQVSNDIVRTEQYMDFLRNRTFRQTLLCRKEVGLKRNLGPSDMQGFYIASPAKPVSENPDVLSNKSEQFRDQVGHTLTTTNPLAKAVFAHLAEIWPQSAAFHDLLSVARTRMAPMLAKDASVLAREAEVLGTDIFTAYTTNMVELHIQKQDFVVEVSARPMVSALARGQARLGSTVTNVRHERLPLDAFNLQLAMLLDGKRDRKALLDELAKLVKDGTLVAQQNGKPIKEGESLRTMLSEFLGKSLQHFAEAALLVK
jgi:methyltransferase-like protein/2-polyprenyl-3-methyl-5-hydroxy-6-metoxy-1,4-benzoquinol methylase